jgi:hypothetical protein
VVQTTQRLPDPGAKCSSPCPRLFDSSYEWVRSSPPLHLIYPYDIGARRTFTWRRSFDSSVFPALFSFVVHLAYFTTPISVAVVGFRRSSPEVSSFRQTNTHNSVKSGSQAVAINPSLPRWEGKSLACNTFSLRALIYIVLVPRGQKKPSWREVLEMKRWWQTTVTFLSVFYIPAR